MRIAVLPDHIASQIAAGEVIERPASVVKELVENSLDSGASQIEISIQSDCRDIRVADNGSGMMPEDAVLAFHRHATSKLRSSEDLWSLHSLGFRGEALPSIAAVSKFTCYTRPSETTSGTKIEAGEGKISATETGCAPGTIMEIVDLFYNVPARLKFLKKASTEFAHIHECIQSLAIAFPHVSFHLLKEGKTVLRTTGSGNFLRAIVESDLFSGLESTCEIDNHESNNDIKIKGLLGKPVHFRGDRKGILSIANNRPVRCPLIYKALDYAYSDLIPKGRYPLAVIILDISPDKVDVNIHPTKKEVKYYNGNEIYISLQHTLTKALRQLENNYSPSSSSSQPSYSLTAESSETRNYANEFIATESIQANSAKSSHTRSKQLSLKQYFANTSNTPNVFNNSSLKTSGKRPEAVDYSADTNDILGAPSKILGKTSYDGVMQVTEKTYFALSKRLLGYLHNTYILVETSDGLEIIEQHIAHERILYERILAQQTIKGRIADGCQHLIISVPLQLSRSQLELIQDHIDVLKTFGFEFEFSENKAICTQVPTELAHTNYASVVQQLIAEISECESANLALEATKSLACQAAIKNGMPLSESDIIQLLNEWEQTERKDTCPHGRPVQLKFSKEKLFQLFHPS